MVAVPTSRARLTRLTKYCTSQACSDGSLPPIMSPLQVERIFHDLNVFFLDRRISISVAASLLHVLGHLLPRHFGSLLLSFRRASFWNIRGIYVILKVTVDSFEKDLYLRYVSCGLLDMMHYSYVLLLPFWLPDTQMLRFREGPVSSSKS
jgi:hypothetical protein